jgi:spore coat protein CotF
MFNLDMCTIILSALKDGKKENITMFTIIQTEQIKQIADRFRLDQQLDKTIEELSDLQRELRDYLFSYKMDEDDITTCQVADKVAEVKIMIAQLEYLLEIEEDVKSGIELKLNWN